MPRSCDERRPPPRGSARGCARRRRARAGGRAAVEDAGAAPPRRHHAAARPARRPRGRGRRAGRRGAPVSSGSGEAAVVGERAVGQADRQLGLEHVRAAGLERLAHLGLRPHRAEQAGARADRRRPACPCSTLSGNGREAQSSAFLSAPGTRGVVLRAWRSGARRRSRSRRGTPGRRPAGSVSRSSSKAGRPREAVPLHELDPGRQRVARRPEQPAVVGSSAQAAGDAEDPHRARPARRARGRRSA